MKLVRRARKSLTERRMKVCLSELTNNLAKVELKVHNHLKQTREAKRASRGEVRPPVPADVVAGIMNEELYEIECRLHREAGIAPPPPFAGKRSASKYVGMVPFSELVRHVARSLSKQRKSGK